MHQNDNIYYNRNKKKKQQKSNYLWGDMGRDLANDTANAKLERNSIQNPK